MEKTLYKDDYYIRKYCLAPLLSKFHSETYATKQKYRQVDNYVQLGAIVVRGWYCVLLIAAHLSEKQGAKRLSGPRHPCLAEQLPAAGYGGAAAPDEPCQGCNACYKLPCCPLTLFARWG